MSIGEHANFSRWATCEEVKSSLLKIDLNNYSHQSLIICKRLSPFISNLLDIDSYPFSKYENKIDQYPKNISSEKHIFNFTNFCLTSSKKQLSRLFGGNES